MIPKGARAEVLVREAALDAAVILFYRARAPADRAACKRDLDLQRRRLRTAMGQHEFAPGDLRR